MRNSSSAESKAQAGDSMAVGPAAVAEQARALLDSMSSFLADADRLSARIRVAVTVPVGLMCILGWGILTAFGSVFMGQARHPELMLAAGTVLLLIGLHSATRRGTGELPATFLAFVVTLIYGTSVLMNGLLPTIFLGAVIIALYVVAPVRVALTLSLAALIATPPLVWLATAGQPSAPHLFRVMVTGAMAITFLHLLRRANARFKAEALRVARGLEALMAPLNASLEQAVRERVRAEDALASAQAAESRVNTIKVQLEDAVSSMSQGLVMVDAEGRVVLCNPQTHRMLGLTEGGVGAEHFFADVLELESWQGETPTADGYPGSAPAAVVAANDQPSVDATSKRTVKTRCGRYVETSSRLMRSGHTVHTYSDVTAYVQANEQLRSAVMGMSLAKEQLAGEMQRAKTESDMKLRFVAAVSHEIRTPLNGITGMVDVLARSGLNDQQAGLISDVKTSTSQLRQLTDDILDLSHIKDASFSLSTTPFDLAALMEKIVRAARGAADSAGLGLELLMRDEPCRVLGDSQRLTQVLNNLIYNAIKFTARGAVRVHAEWRDSVADDSVEVIISVADSGRGIATSALSSIFEPFNQGDTSTNRDFGGTGLGLALCRELCTSMGGTIRVASRLNHGSVFTVMVCLRSTKQASDFENSCPSDVDESIWRLDGKRILVVDDNRINQKLLSLWLAEAGATFQVAGDGAEGVRVASAQRFDAILMDVSMPVMNGLDATRAIRTLARHGDDGLWQHSTVPIIGVTAMARNEDLRQCLEAGMDAHLSKPLSRGALLRTLNEVISTHAWLSDVSAVGIA
jgi:signal transduction histidine kinase/PAS domain-containing protein/AmiR/NasT family two-component response regulator